MQSLMSHRPASAVHRCTILPNPTSSEDSFILRLETHPNHRFLRFEFEVRMAGVFGWELPNMPTLCPHPVTRNAEQQ